jgi:hypothetical protein
MWSCQLFIYIGLLLWLMGWSALAGLSILFLSMPLIGKLSAIQQELRKSALQVTLCWGLWFRVIQHVYCG